MSVDLCPLSELSAVSILLICVLQVEWRGEILQLSWSPRAYHLKGFLSDEECEHIKKIVSNSSNSSQHHILLAVYLLHVPVGSTCWLVLLSCMHLHKPILQLPNSSWHQLHAANSSCSKPFTQWYGVFLVLCLQSRDQLTASDVVNNLTGKSERSLVSPQHSPTATYHALHSDTAPTPSHSTATDQQCTNQAVPCCHVTAQQLIKSAGTRQRLVPLSQHSS
jgi:hypothetical protein